jgi:serine phosphatase RsbU (regulator of sigma subunit)
MPAVLHAIGSTKDDIDKALDGAKQRQAEKEECERCEQQYAKADHDLNIKERQIGLKRTEAETKKIEHEAVMPRSSGSSGGSSSDSR